MNQGKIKEINVFIHSRFYYTYDNPGHDTWKSHAVSLMNIPGYKIYDDCDGLACTTAHYLSIFGAEQVWRVLASMEGGPTIDHMVALVKDDTGQLWIVGDTADNYQVKLESYRGRLFLYNNIKDGINWRESPQEFE